MKDLLSAGFKVAAGVSASMDAVKGMPFLVQVLLCLIILGFTEWCVHNLLHRVNILWSFHRVHHSIHTMDWIGNFRFHWMELILYNTVKFLPIALLAGDRWEVLLYVAIIST